MNHARAALFREVGKIEIDEVPVRNPLIGEVLIRMVRASVCGSDVHIWKGEIDLTALGVDMPIILGHEGYGFVEALGAGINTDVLGQRLHEGDVVTFRYFSSCGNCKGCNAGRVEYCPHSRDFLGRRQNGMPLLSGTFADYFLLDANPWVVKVPEWVDHRILPSLNCAVAQVVYAVRCAEAQPNMSAVVFGVGGLGMWATMYLRDMGVTTVAVDPDSGRGELAKRCGADAVVSLPTNEAVWESLRALGATDGADLVFDFVGIPDVLTSGLRLLAPGGRVVEVGGVTPGTASVAPSQLVFGNHRIVGVELYDKDALVESVRFCGSLDNRYPIDELFGKTWDLTETEAALQASASRHAFRPIITVSDKA